MKKVLSVLCMALLAGGMIFTSCTKNFTITVNSNNDAWGTVSGAGSYADGATATLTATPKEGYLFVKWQDGNTDNPRTITVTADATYTAYFEAIPTPPPANPGVKVTFNTDNYEAGAYSGSYNANYHAWQVIAAKTNGDYPYTDVAMYTGTSTGSHTDQATDNGQFAQESEFGWVEYYLEGYVYFQDAPDTHYGDWWAKNATVKVTDFDATSLKMTANVNAAMFDVIGAFGEGGTGLAAAPTVPMVVDMTSINLQSAKGFTPKTHKGGKLVAAR